MLKVRLEELTKRSKGLDETVQALKKQLEIHTPETLYIKPSDYKSCVAAAHRMAREDKSQVEITLNGIPVRAL